MTNDYARVKTPLALGEIVSVLPEVIVNAAVDSVQKQSALPAPAPVLFRIRAYLMLLRLAPEAVNTSPAVVYVNRICRVDAPTVHRPVAGRIVRPPVTYPPVAEISPVTDANVEMPPLLTRKMFADALAR
jgi:hypothetical protein